MPSDEQKLKIQFEASSRKLEKSIDRIDRKLGKLNKDTRDDFQRTNKSVTSSAEGMLRGLSEIGGATVGIGAVAGALRSVAAAGDEVKLITGRFDALTGSAERASVLVEGLFDIAADTGAELQTTADALTAFRIAADDIGAADDEVIQFTANIQKLGVIGGASNEAISRGIRQLSQGLAGGILRAEEFNSIIENTPFVATAIADALQVSVGELRKMVIDGKVLASDVFAGINKQSGEIQDKFEKIPTSVDRATGRLVAAFTRTKAQLDDNLGVSRAWAGVLNLIADRLEAATESQKQLAALSSRIEVAPGRTLTGEAAQAEDARIRLGRGRVDASGFGILDPRGDDVAQGRVNPFGGFIEEAKRSAEDIRNEVNSEFEGAPIRIDAGVSFEDAFLQAEKEALRLADALDPRSGRYDAQYGKITASLGEAKDSAAELQESLSGGAGSLAAAEIELVDAAIQNAISSGETLFDTLSEGLDAAIFRGKSLDDVLENALSRLASTAFQQFLEAAFTGSAPSGLAGSLLSSFGGFRANGGPVSPSKGYVVGENGPEYFQPRVAGQIYNKSQMKSGGMTFAPVFQITGNDSPAAVRAAVEQAIPQMAAVARRVVADERRRF